MKCHYGCGGIAKYKFKNGKWCCSKSPNQCPEMKKKNSLSLLGHRDRNKDHKENRKIVVCEYCGKGIANTGIKSHKEYCYLNPKNKRLCPICEAPIKKFKTNKTCSSRCGSLLGNITSSNGDTKTNYRAICFHAHGRACLICGEDLFVIAHHIDGNRTNNISENLIPLCHTHHLYIHHHEYNYIIKECIDEYMFKFLGSQICAGIDDDY